MLNQLVRAIFVLFIVSIFIFILAPIIFVLLSSFSRSSMLSFPPTDFSLEWYKHIPSDFIQSLKISIIVAIATALTATVLGVPAGMALSRGNVPGLQFINALLMSPLMLPTLVIGVSLYSYYIFIWDISKLPLAGNLSGLIIGHSSFAIPYVIRNVTASLALFDTSLEEAAMNLGANPRQAFFKVTVPIIMPGIIAGAIFAFIVSFDDVPVSLFLAGANSTTLPIKIFTSIEFSLTPVVMAVAAMIVYISVALLLILERMLGLNRILGSKS